MGIRRFIIIISAALALMLAAGCAQRAAEYVSIPAAAPTLMPAAPVQTVKPTPTAVPTPTATPKPTAEPTPEPTPEIRRATVGFVGDILMMTRQIADAKTETGYDFGECFLPMADVFEAVDIMCADFEGTLGGEEAGYTQPKATPATATEENPNPTNPPMQSFSAPDELAKNLFDAGIDAVTTANNHAMDRDDAGLFRTIRVLRAAGIKTVGTALSTEDFLTPCIIEKNGIKIGLIGATQILNSTAPKIDAENRDFALTRLDGKMVKSQISACTGAGAEFIIVMVHWGYEHQSREDESQRRYAARLTEWGADAVIGAHSHCPQPMEWLEAERNGQAIRVPVVYSLGNFISNMSQEYAKIGVFARISITKDEGGVRCDELACLPVYCCRAAPADGGREIHRTLPCLAENGAVVNAFNMDEGVHRAMQKAYDHVAAVCIGEREDIHMIERSEIYAGEA